MKTTLNAYQCVNGHVSYPKHPMCNICGLTCEKKIPLSNLEATVITWTTSTVPTPGVRSPNTIAIVEYEIEGCKIKILGGVDAEKIKIGDKVKAKYIPELRDPKKSKRFAESQYWGGHRFELISE
jgi:uncharacterized OB-fold protein